MTNIKDYDEREVIEMLRESNAIEGVFDSKSLEQALHAWHYVIQFNRLTPAVIQRTHKILSMHWKDLKTIEKGFFRTVPVYIGGHAAVPAKEVKPRINAWCNKVNRHRSKIDDVLDSIALHVEYEGIHPFIDGNGRTGRIFLNWTRLKKTHESILTFYASERYEYYKLFK